MEKWLIFNNKIYECSLSGKERKQRVKIIKRHDFPIILEKKKKNMMEQLKYIKAIAF